MNSTHYHFIGSPNFLSFYALGYLDENRKILCNTFIRDVNEVHACMYTEVYPIVILMFWRRVTEKLSKLAVATRPSRRGALN